MRFRERPHVRLATSLIGGAILGKVVGLIREIVQARILGTTILADSFRGALGVIIVPIAPLQGDAIASVLIPLHREWKSAGVATRMLSSLVLSFFVVSMLAACLVWVLADPATSLLVAGFGPAAHETTVSFVRVLVVSMPAYVVTAVLVAAEISIGRSRIATLRAAVQNLGIIGGIVAMHFTGYILAIPWGYAVGCNAIAFYGGAKLWREQELALRCVCRADFVQATTIFLGRIWGLSGQPLAEQLTMMVERLLASTLAIGTLASLDYARTLTDTAMLLIGQPLGYVVLSHSAPNEEDTPKLVTSFARPLLGIGIPVSIFLVVFASDIVRLVFARGVFDEHAVALTAGALRGIAAGLWATTLGWIVVRMVILAGRRTTAAKCIMAGYFANIGVDLVMASPLGSLGLGLGEGMRGLVILIGASLALRSGRAVLLLLARALPATVVLTGAYILIACSYDQPLLRLSLGALAFAIYVGGWLIFSAPDVLQAMLRRGGFRRA